MATIGMYGERKMNARCSCTPPSTVGTFGKVISAEACSGKEIAGLLRKMGMTMMMNNDDTKIMKSREQTLLEAGRNGLGSCIARDESKSCCCVF